MSEKFFSREIEFKTRRVLRLLYFGPHKSGREPWEGTAIVFAREFVDAKKLDAEKRKEFSSLHKRSLEFSRIGTAKSTAFVDCSLGT